MNSTNPADGGAQGGTTVLVTGGAGFLGSTLCRTLLRRGSTVLCLDNLSSGRRDAIDDLLETDGFTFLYGDVVDPLDINVDVHEVYHLACPASPRYYLDHPVETMKTSVIGTLHVLDFARLRGIPILHASTSEVYGDPAQHPQREEYFGNVNPTGPRACYDEGKRAAEALCFDFKRLHQVDVRVARIFNSYGPNMHPSDGRVVSTLIAQALRNEPLTVYGDGTQTRSFCHVTDMIDGFLGLMKIPSSPQGPVNLGNPEEITVLHLAETILELTGSSSTIEFRELPADDPSRRRPDISRATELFDWRPATSLKTGLRATIAYVERAFSLDGVSARGALEE